MKARTAALAIPFMLLATPAGAHVKWFAPFIVGAAPRPVSATLHDPFFWLGILLVIVFFLLARIVERSALGPLLLGGLDWISTPVWARLDDFIRAVIAGFFIAIFAVGGVYLTPDLKTPAEWVSWLQLLIAGLVFFRATRPAAALLIIALWLLALRDYPLFHLFDYLALGVAVAGYLFLDAMPDHWRKHRMTVLRTGVAIALMWSSLEKFAYPEWFWPLTEERPYLTLGLHRDAFIPMAGVAEFTLGFGMLWTPLIRRLSAISLFVIFTAAVWPFGRVDLVGHALIMAVLVAIAADHTREEPSARPSMFTLLRVPAGLVAALVVFVSAYWGLHMAIYGAEGQPGADRSTHTHEEAGQSSGVE